MRARWPCDKHSNDTTANTVWSSRRLRAAVAQLARRRRSPGCRARTGTASASIAFGPDGVARRPSEARVLPPGWSAVEQRSGDAAPPGHAPRRWSPSSASPRPAARLSVVYAGWGRPSSGRDGGPGSLRDRRHGEHLRPRHAGGDGRRHRQGREAAVVQIVTALLLESAVSGAKIWHDDRGSRATRTWNSHARR